MLLQVATFRGVLPVSGCIDPESGLCQVLVDFIESMRQNLESDQVAVSNSLSFRPLISFLFLVRLPSRIEMGIFASYETMECLISKWLSRISIFSLIKRLRDQ